MDFVVTNAVRPKREPHEGVEEHPNNKRIKMEHGDQSLSNTPPDTSDSDSASGKSGAPTEEPNQGYEACIPEPLAQTTPSVVEACSDVVMMVRADTGQIMAGNQHLDGLIKILGLGNSQMGLQLLLAHVQAKILTLPTSNPSG